MRHWRARRLLASLLDETLPLSVEDAVREHVAVCAHCRSQLRDLEACDVLVRRLPSSLLPLAPHPAAERKLRALARWDSRRAPLRRRPWRVAAALGRGAAGVAVGAILFAFLLGPHPPRTEPLAHEEIPAEPFNFVLASSDPGADLPAVHRAVVTSGRGGQTPLELYLLPAGLR